MNIKLFFHLSLTRKDYRRGFLSAKVQSANCHHGISATELKSLPRVQVPFSQYYVNNVSALFDQVPWEKIGERAGVRSRTDTCTHVRKFTYSICPNNHCWWTSCVYSAVNIPIETCPSLPYNVYRYILCYYVRAANFHWNISVFERLKIIILKSIQYM